MICAQEQPTRFAFFDVGFDCQNSSLDAKELRFDQHIANIEVPSLTSTTGTVATSIFSPMSLGRPLLGTSSSLFSGSNCSGVDANIADDRDVGNLVHVANDSLGVPAVA